MGNRPAGRHDHEPMSAKDYAVQHGSTPGTAVHTIRHLCAGEGPPHEGVRNARAKDGSRRPRREGGSHGYHILLVGHPHVPGFSRP